MKRTDGPETFDGRAWVPRTGLTSERWRMWSTPPAHIASLLRIDVRDRPPDCYGVTAGTVVDLRRAASDAPADAATTSAIPPSSRPLRP
jgi:hypothetical protein